MLKLLETRRSMRQFEPKKIEPKKIDELIKAALLAPSSRRRQPWEYIVVTDEVMLKKLAACRGKSSGFLADAPLAFVIAADPKACDVWVEDCAVAATVIHLTAHAMGLGSCWIQVRKRQTEDNTKAQKQIKRDLNIPKSYRVACMLAIGYPGEKKPGYDEADLPMQKVHKERYT